MRPFDSLENKMPSDTYRRIRLVCVKVHADIFSEPPQKYNQDQMLLTNQGGYYLLNQLDSYMNVMEFQISPRMKNR